MKVLIALAAVSKKLAVSKPSKKDSKLPTACTETANIPSSLKGKFSSRLGALEKKYKITRAGVTSKGVDIRGRGHYTFHYERQPGWSAFKKDISKLWTKFVSDFPKAKSNMR